MEAKMIYGMLFFIILILGLMTINELGSILTDMQRTILYMITILFFGTAIGYVIK